MIKSCEKCKDKCCSMGPGPYKFLSPGDYLEVFGTTEGYNTKCLAFDRFGRCKLWGSSTFPIACRTFICTTRSYTKEELDKIDSVHDRECEFCDSEWVYVYEKKDEWYQECPACGETFVWKKLFPKEMRV